MPLENRSNVNTVNRAAVIRIVQTIQSTNQNLPEVERTPELLQRQIYAQEDMNTSLSRRVYKLSELLELEKQRNRQKGWITAHVVDTKAQMELDGLRVENNDLMEEIQFRVDERNEMLDYIRQLEWDKRSLTEVNNQYAERIDLQEDQLHNLNLENQRYFERNNRLDAALRIVEEQRDFVEDELEVFKKDMEWNASMPVHQEFEIVEASQLVAAKEDNRELGDMLLAKDERIMELERQRDEQFDVNHRENVFFTTLLETQSQTLDTDAVEIDLLRERVADLEDKHHLSEEQRSETTNDKYDALRQQLIQRNAGQTERILELEVVAQNQARDLTNANTLIAMNLEHNERYLYTTLEEAYLHTVAELQRFQKQVVTQEEFGVAEILPQEHISSFRR